MKQLGLGLKLSTKKTLERATVYFAQIDTVPGDFPCTSYAERRLTSGRGRQVLVVLGFSEGNRINFYQRYDYRNTNVLRRHSSGRGRPGVVVLLPQLARLPLLCLPGRSPASAVRLALDRDRSCQQRP